MLIRWILDGKGGIVIIGIWIIMAIMFARADGPLDNWGPEFRINVGECRAFTQGALASKDILLASKESKTGQIKVANGGTVNVCGTKIHIFAEVIDGRTFLTSPDVEMDFVTRDLSRAELGINVTAVK